MSCWVNCINSYISAHITLPMLKRDALGYDANTTIRLGPYSIMLPPLLRKGYEPKNTVALMDDRIAPDVPSDVMSERWDTEFSTLDGIAASKDKLLVDINSPLLRDVTVDTCLHEGGLDIPSDYVGNIERIERSEAGILNEWLREEDARRHATLFILAGRNQDRLDKYVTKAFKRVKDKLERDTALGIWVGHDGLLRPVTLYDTHDGAGFECRGLEYGYARFVGVAAEQEDESDDCGVVHGNVMYDETDILIVQELLSPDQPLEGLQDRLREASRILRARRQTPK